MRDSSNARLPTIESEDLSVLPCSSFHHLARVFSVFPVKTAMPAHLSPNPPSMVSSYFQMIRFLCGVLLDRSLKRSRVGTHNLLDLLAIGEDLEGRHGADAEVLSNVGDLVDVDLVEADVGVLVGEAGEVSWGGHGGR